MLPKPLYEALPFTCFLVGSGLWLYGESFLIIFAGVLLYCASALQWVLRTSHRRNDRVIANLVGRSHDPNIGPRYRRWLIPRPLYEWMPFIYIGLGYLISNFMRWGQWPPTYLVDLAIIAAFMLCAAGFLVLFLRGMHRLDPYTPTHNH